MVLVAVTPADLLAFEQRWPRHTGTKDLTIPRDLGITSARFYQLLHRAAHSHDGIASHPITARRVRARVSR